MSELFFTKSEKGHKIPESLPQLDIQGADLLEENEAIQLSTEISFEQGCDFVKEQIAKNINTIFSNIRKEIEKISSGFIEAEPLESLKNQLLELLEQIRKNFAASVDFQVNDNNEVKSKIIINDDSTLRGLSFINTIESLIETLNDHHSNLNLRLINHQASLSQIPEIIETNQPLLEEAEAFNPNSAKIEKLREIIKRAEESLKQKSQRHDRTQKSIEDLTNWIKTFLESDFSLENIEDLLKESSDFIQSLHIKGLRQKDIKKLLSELKFDPQLLSNIRFKEKKSQKKKKKTEKTVKPHSNPRITTPPPPQVATPRLQRLQRIQKIQKEKRNLKFILWVLTGLLLALGAYKIYGNYNDHLVPIENLTDKDGTSPPIPQPINPTPKVWRTPIQDEYQDYDSCIPAAYCPNPATKIEKPVIVELAIEEPCEGKGCDESCEGKGCEEISGEKCFEPAPIPNCEELPGEIQENMFEFKFTPSGWNPKPISVNVQNENFVYASPDKISTISPELRSFLETTKEALKVEIPNLEDLSDEELITELDLLRKTLHTHFISSLKKDILNGIMYKEGDIFYVTHRLTNPYTAEIKMNNARISALEQFRDPEANLYKVVLYQTQEVDIIFPEIPDFNSKIYIEMTYELIFDTSPNNNSTP
ncbi:hypothetical protein ACFL21_01075 [Patescibacteria group bacterium]